MDHVNRKLSPAKPTNQTKTNLIFFFRLKEGGGKEETRERKHFNPIFIYSIAEQLWGIGGKMLFQPYPNAQSLATVGRDMLLGYFDVYSGVAEALIFCFIF